MTTNEEIISNAFEEKPSVILLEKMLDEARLDTAKQIFDELEKLRIDYGFDIEYLISEFEKTCVEYLTLKMKYQV